MASSSEITLDVSSAAQAFLADNSFPAPSPGAADNVVIAPWLAPDEEPPTPPPKASKSSFGFAPKASFSSFSLGGKPSLSSVYGRGRGSDTSSFGESQAAWPAHSELHPPPREIHKVKSSKNIMNILRRSRSKSRASHPSLPGLVPPAHSPELPSFHPMSAPPSPPPPILPRIDKIRGKRRQAAHTPPAPGVRPSSDPEITLDTNLEEMDGIIDMTAVPPLPDSSSPGATYPNGLSSASSASDHGHGPSQRPLPPPPPSIATTIFSNPFSGDAAARPPFLNFDSRKVSPKSLVQGPFPASDDGHNRPPSPSWTAPESWAVEKEGETGETGYSSSEESVGPANANGNGSRRKRRRTARAAAKSTAWTPYKLRIYRANNTYHVVTIATTVTVADLTPVLNKKLLLDPEREAHRLYLKERGRERVLAQTERPADILRRRLEQAGYDVADGLDLLGQDDLGFLIKFVYKTTLLGPAEEDVNLDSYEYVNLTGRSLRTVPVVLYVNADMIVILDLSRNPMLEIPLDFIQACTTLRDLRLSNMAMKKVPHSVRHCVTLNRLDLTCNRIGDLDEAGLELIPDLQLLKLENNRMEKLPWYFPRLRALRYLNISNNKFQHLPAVVSEILSLQDLDISFNSIAELPEEIGQLKKLETLIMVGNQVSKFPAEASNLVSLRVLDCRRNNISDLSIVCLLPKLETLHADYNAVHGLDLSLGPCLKTLEASRNDITLLTITPSQHGAIPFTLSTLDVSHAKLSSLDEDALAHLTALEVLRLDHNSFRFLPESLGDLSRLTHLSCSNNQLDAIPASIGRLQRLEMLDMNSNSLKQLPATLWNCASLVQINATSNLLDVWHDPPPPVSASTLSVLSAEGSASAIRGAERKMSTAGSIAGDRTRAALPPLAYSLERLYLGENQLTDEVLRPLTVLKELRVLNLSFNDIQDMPATFFKNLLKLEELYLSGNKLSSIPTEDLHKLNRLSILFLNGNKLQTLPTELGKVTSLTVLDVGSNILKYNINNWEYDWNWNFNTNLRYLNLSGNKRLVVRPEATNHRASARDQAGRKVLADFSHLTQLRVLGLMDVTTFMDSIPDENEDRRVRTSLSEVNGMAYGIADTLGKGDHLTMFDLVQPDFRDNRNEAVFAIFGRAQPFASNNRLSKYLHDTFLPVFHSHLTAVENERGDNIAHALRRSFLKLNKYTYDHIHNTAYNRKMSTASASTATTALRDMSSIKSGASGIVLYIRDRKMYVANAGNALAVVCRQGSAQGLSRKHDPFDREETARIRAAEGWVSPKGLVNDEIDISRSFGFYHLSPVINPRPDIHVYQLTESDEFVIIGNRGLWDYVSYQTAVDIARSERGDPMIAAQKLRDFAISYGADGSIMIMVISVAGLFRGVNRSRQPTSESLIDPETYASLRNRRRKDDIADRNISRLDVEVPPPVGHLTLAFTDIRNSTHLWEVNAGMPTAMRLHNNLLRRQLRLCGGYEVKTEGDAFICSFPTALAALWWCLKCQVELLHEAWPLEILECEDGKEIFDATGKLIARGLSVRMGLHCGIPVCEPDPITHRMDYFGPIVNRTARVSGSAAGGQIMCSTDVLREINAKIFEIEPETEYSYAQPLQAISAIREMKIVVVPRGEVKLKGLEVPESLSVVYPADLEGRQLLGEKEEDPNALASRVQFSVVQMRELALLCVRLEFLASARVFRPLARRKGSTATAEDTPDSRPAVFAYGDPNVLLPAIGDKPSDADLSLLLDSLSVRIENALASLTLAQRLTDAGAGDGVVKALRRRGLLDERTLEQISALLDDG